MSSKSPLFPMAEPQHFSDYGFDPQIDYFQVLEEARKHKRESVRSIDALHFKLQKPISKDDVRKGSSSKSLKKRRWWWKNALFFFKSKCASHHHKRDEQRSSIYGSCRSISGPIYVTESLSGSNTPCRTTSRPLSGPLTPARKMKYFSLKDLNMDHNNNHHGMSISSPMPIYLVS